MDIAEHALSAECPSPPFRDTGHSGPVSYCRLYQCHGVSTLLPTTTNRTTPCNAASRAPADRREQCLCRAPWTGRIGPAPLRRAASWLLANGVGGGMAQSVTAGAAAVRVPVIVRVGPRLWRRPGVAAGSTCKVAMPMAVALLLARLLAIVLLLLLRAWGARRRAPPSSPPRLGWGRACAAAHVQP